MQWLKKILNQVNQAPLLSHGWPTYHSPTNFYPNIHLAIKIPNLPAPFHYLNFVVFIGQINNSAFEKCSTITIPDQHVTVLSSVSAPMVGHLREYEVTHQCNLSNRAFAFDQREIIFGEFPNFKIERQDSELSFDLNIHTRKLIAYFTQLKMGLADHWSLLCDCKGKVYYKNQIVDIDQIATFEYARISKWLFVPYAFYCYQLINIDQHRQLILLQVRTAHNQIIQSKAYLRSDLKQSTIIFSKVDLFIHRVYPQVKTINNKSMYLARELEWRGKTEEGEYFNLIAFSRGDYKFGFGAGFVGSFSYHLYLNNEEISGNSGYCEYIDQRLLKWQEHTNSDDLLDKTLKPIPIMLKKP